MRGEETGEIGKEREEEREKRKEMERGRKVGIAVTL